MQKLAGDREKIIERPAASTASDQVASEFAADDMARNVAPE